ncbi:Fungal specific transcription factor domain [Rhizoctonia solani]|uniref:Fungal specific transcription factor domain n=1 Tax=Rhizoctonia solani TaxID=456999 RepID=A0A8H7H324_9AGAM|nr:Fungal specific transcription factor domain [Rhizoctonia solani]
MAHNPHYSSGSGGMAYTPGHSPPGSASSPNSTSSGSASRCVTGAPHVPIAMSVSDVVCMRGRTPVVVAESQRYNAYLDHEKPHPPIGIEYSIRDDLREVNEDIDKVLERYTRLSVSSKPYWEVQEVLDQLANLPPTHLNTNDARAVFAQRADPQGAQYWQEGPSSNLVLRGMINERAHVPDILLSGVVGPREANELFERFMQYWNHGLGLLDPAIHSPRTLLQRCPLLFTIVLTIASRDYTTRPNLYPQLLQQAKLSASAALVDGLKDADTVQALLLVAAYPPPVQRFTDDRTSLFVGMALRMATDLNLHLASRQAPVNRTEALELANHIRTWRACLLLDSWSSVKHGRLPSLRPSSGQIRGTDAQSIQSELEYKIFKAVNEFMQFAKSSNGALDYMELTMGFNNTIQTLRDEVHHFTRRAEDRDQQSGMLRKGILRQTIEYARMVVYSFGFTRSLQQGDYWGGDFTMMCLEAASASVNGFLERLAPLPLFKCSPDAWFEYAAFSAAFLLKLLRPQFQNIIHTSERGRVAELVKRLVDWYRSPHVALPIENHLPRVLADFLERAASHIPEYTAAAGSRGLSRTTRQTPSPPSSATYSGGFNLSPGESLATAMCGTIPEWWEYLDRELPGHL